MLGGRQGFVRREGLRREPGVHAQRRNDLAEKRRAVIDELDRRHRFRSERRARAPKRAVMRSWPEGAQSRSKQEIRPSAPSHVSVVKMRPSQLSFAPSDGTGDG